MGSSLEHVLWVVLSGLSSCVIGVCLYFIKRLVDKTEHTIEQVMVLSEQMKNINRLEKRVESTELILSNLSQLISTEFARLNETMKWLQRNRLK